MVRAGRFETIEGEPPYPRIVVIEFPNFEKAKARYDSPEYRALIPIRQGAARGRSILIEGAGE